MSAGIAALIVIVLLVIALYPAKPKQSLSHLTEHLVPGPASRSLREQQTDEEALAISAEYRRLAQAAWLAELREKASVALGSKPTEVR